MSNTSERQDLFPDTPTAAALRAAVAEPPLAGPRKPTRREVEVDPTSPDAPTCKPRRFITVDPDAPDAPVCKPRRYIIVPEPKELGAGRMPDGARELGRRLAEEFGARE